MRFRKSLLVVMYIAAFGVSSGALAHKHKHEHYKGEMAQPAPTVCQVTRFDGFYLGGSLGVINNDFSLHDNIGHVIDQGEVSPTVELFGGYRKIFENKYSLGGEIFGNSTIGDASTNTTVIDGGGTHVKNTTRYSYGISILPGMLLNERTLGYLRVGAVGTRFNTLVNDPSPIAQSTTHTTRVGAELGFGLETNIVCNFDLRAEYLHTFYKSIHTSINSYNIHPTSDRVNLGVVYKFM